VFFLLASICKTSDPYLVAANSGFKFQNVFAWFGCGKGLKRNMLMVYVDKMVDEEYLNLRPPVLD
jgi:hypothetical protein